MGTAFGLMEFADMAQVQTVDEAMIARTRDWLLRQQNADGSWQGDQSEFFTFQTSLVRNTAFVVWALASAGYTGSQLQSGLAYVKQNLATEKLDAYSLGIIANAFVLAALWPLLSTVSTPGKPRHRTPPLLGKAYGPAELWHEYPLVVLPASARRQHHGREQADVLAHNSACLLDHAGVARKTRTCACERVDRARADKFADLAMQVAVNHPRRTRGRRDGRFGNQAFPQSGREQDRRASDALGDVRGWHARQCVEPDETIDSRVFKRKINLALDENAKDFSRPRARTHGVLGVCDQAGDG
jgi:hypothetical protein